MITFNCTFIVVPGQELNDAPVSVGPSMPQNVIAATNTCAQVNAANPGANVDANASQGSSVSGPNNHEISAPVSVAPIPLAAGSLINARPGSMVRVPETIANGRKFQNVRKKKEIL